MVGHLAAHFRYFVGIRNLVNLPHVLRNAKILIRGKVPGVRFGKQSDLRRVQSSQGEIQREAARDLVAEN